MCIRDSLGIRKGGGAGLRAAAQTCRHSFHRAWTFTTHTHTVLGALGAFGFGWGTGANDVGNAFGTSVGAKTLTMLQVRALCDVVFPCACMAART